MGAGAGGKGGAPAPPGFSQAAHQGIGQGVDNAAGAIGSQGALPTGQEARDQAITAAYGQATSRLDPQWDQRQGALTAQLANQGLSTGSIPGGKAAADAMAAFGRDRNDAYSSAMNGAIGQGTAAGSALFNQGVTAQMLPYQQLAALQGIQTSDYNNQLQGYSADQAGKNSMLGGGMGLAGQLGSAYLTGGL